MWHGGRCGLECGCDGVGGCRGDRCGARRGGCGRGGWWRGGSSLLSSFSFLFGSLFPPSLSSASSEVGPPHRLALLRLAGFCVSSLLSLVVPPPLCHDGALVPYLHPVGCCPSRRPHGVSPPPNSPPPPLLATPRGRLAAAAATPTRGRDGERDGDGDGDGNGGGGNSKGVWATARGGAKATAKVTLAAPRRYFWH